MTATTSLLARTRGASATTSQRTPRPKGPALTPVWREVDADLETPVSAYLKLARGRYGYLL
ncbi:MAG TPA: hypothetical protein VID72_11585, partial [Ktedonobacterales bacterium]